ncbi:MAG: hypothetical protein IME94_07940 [Proteobacteria bacterium]|nr:hypothetical protein [Pseudomonadota bacterium]
MKKLIDQCEGVLRRSSYYHSARHMQSCKYSMVYALQPCSDNPDYYYPVNSENQTVGFNSNNTRVAIKPEDYSIHKDDFNHEYLHLNQHGVYLFWQHQHPWVDIESMNKYKSVLRNTFGIK